ncbi:D-arabinono-1,4-lactone oxidase [Legionella jordanis]|uniref:L-gulono-1,4-lactone dehydrogenase n=1 Tax=Legionella jordanis TaxID=456 RepID=A0A0W0VHS0_9GAMM|nr:D-arabinono-1,4-lactone oxidase [Legionella jordanis]KTD19241.1 L-gulono-1,4-lactone dehydrogenase [Legionella jordanis]RMW99823.1 FAD-binding protein [Legionella jordanis]RMX18776.1 FAD-binding protein [Legionella jordanis]VEH12873.1 Probable xylitol oxidase [Legionella jordanis]HAT8714873.1 FAD-binding protein [Legionella jordanis]
MNQAKAIKNWGKTFEYTPRELYYPSSLEELTGVLQTCYRAEKSIRPLGSRYSYTPLIFSNEVALSLDSFSGIEEVNYDEMTVVVRGGTKIADLERELFARGLSLINLGDINQQTIAGLIATGSHGTGLSFGIASTQIVWMQIVTADGEIIECSETENHEIFKAAQVSLGCLGVISKVKMKVLPKYYMHQERNTVEFDEALDNLLDSFLNNRNYEFFWFPYTEYVFEKKHNISSTVKSTKKFKKIINDYVLENGALWLLCEMSRNTPKFYRKHINFILKKLNSNLCGTIPSTECYATKRLVNHREIEYSIPIDQATQVLINIRDLLNHHDQQLSFPIEVRSVAADNIYLSPNYGRSTVWIAVHSYTKDEYEEVFRDVEKIFLNHQGKPHWGKLHWLKHEQINKLYPKLPRFNFIRKQLDPNGRLMNSYLRGLLGE